MSNTLPTVTVIIAARPGQAEIKAVTAARLLDYPADKRKILVARGTQPSVQRNAAIRAAQGDIIYFLDDDSVPPLDSLKRAVAHFADPMVKMVGGPNLCPPDSPALEQSFSIAMGSWLAFGPSCARYRSVGVARPSSEKELILCNLLARRDALLELGGFNEKLYPNEENALMDELMKRGGKLIYDPELIVHRRPRSTFMAFLKMLMTYGRGRAEQFRLHPTPGSALNFVPPLFCVYLVTLPFLPEWLQFAAFAYLFLVAVQAIILLPARRLHWWPWIMFLIFLSHVLYGIGFWRGCFTSLKPPAQEVSAEVKLESVGS